MRALALAALVAAGGCSQILGIEDPVDTGGIVAPPNTVIGTATTRCLQVDDQTIALPRDLTTTGIRALIPDESSATGFRSEPGTGKADGTFQIDDVPDGAPYVLGFDDSYYVTGEHTLKLRFDTSQRCEPPPAIAQATTMLDLAIAGTEPFIDQSTHFGTNDTLQLDSTAIAYTKLLAPTDGQAGTTATFDWLSGTEYYAPAIPLLDQSVGDDFTLSHIRTTRASMAERRIERSTLVETLATTGLTLVSGMPATITGTYTPIATNRQIMVDLDRGEYDAAFASSEAANTGIQVTIAAAPVQSNDGLGIPVYHLNLTDWTHGSSLMFYNLESYADPFPEDWNHYLKVRYYTLRLFEVYGQNYGTPAGYTAVIPTADTPSFVPAVTVPTNVTLGGQPFTLGGSVLITDTQPIELAWTAVSGARIYELTVSRFASSGSDVTVRYIAHLQTADTHLAIPAEVFAGATYFTLTLAATVTPADYDHGELVSNGTPAARAALSSGLFRIGTTCGNGVVDPDEACDGEAADCDRDCTLPLCGDGMVNTLAGESCDDEADTYSCDEDCTPNVCGDGYVNGSNEDCEPPGSAGCSATCHFTAVCGNGVVELSEACDGDVLPAGMCNPDCTLPGCGDGYLQAGEACDDGNTADGDTCSATCTLP